MVDTDTREMRPDFSDEEGGEISRTMVSDGPDFTDTLERVTARTTLVPSADLMAVRELIGESQRELATLEDPAKRARLHHALGTLLAARFDDWDEALINLQLAHELQPDQIGYLWALRHAYRHLQNWTQVLALVDAELEGCEDRRRRALLLYEEGVIYADRLLNEARALECYEAAFALDPGNWPLFGRLRRLYQAREDHLSLIACCQKAVASTSARRRRSMLYLLLGELQADAQRDSAAAMESFSLAFVEEPRNAAARLRLCSLYEQHERWGDLVDVLTTDGDLEEAGPAKGDRYLHAGRICRDRLGQPGRAADLLERAVLALGAKSIALAELSELLEDAARYEELTAIYHRCIEEAEGRSRGALHCALGRVYARLGDTGQAVQHLSFAHQYEASGALPRLERLLRLAGRWEEWVDVALAWAACHKGAARAAHLGAVAGVLERELKDEAQAISVYRAALALDAGFAEARERLRELLSRAGDHEAVLQLLEGQLQAMADVVQRAGLLFEMGCIAEYGLADAERAARYYQKAAEGGLDSSMALRAHRRALSLAGDRRGLQAVAAASPATDDASTLSPRAAALLLQALGKREEALRCFGEALRQDPRDEVASLGLIRLLEQGGAHRELAEALEKRVELVEEQRPLAELHRQLAELYARELDQPQMALGHYREALALQPAREDLFVSLLELCRAEGRWEEFAETVVGRCEVAAGGAELAQLQLLLGTVYREKLGDEERALEAFRRAVSADPKSITARETLARSLRERKEHASLLKLLEEAAQLAYSSREQCDQLKELARLRVQLGMLENATSDYEAALDLDPGDTETIDALAGLYVRAKEYDALVDVLCQLASFATDGVDRAQIFNDAARWSEAYLGLERDAVPIYRQALESNPQDEVALVALERIAAERGELALTEETCERLFERASDPICRAELGLRLEATQEAAGALGAAAATLEDVVRVDPQWLILHTLRRLYELQGDWTAVARTLEREARASADQARRRVALHAAAELYYEQLASPDQALELLREVLREDPYHGEAAHLLEQIMVQRGDWGALVEALKERVAVSRRQEHPGEAGGIQAFVALLVRIAWIQREHLGRPDEAIATLHQVLDAEPHHPPTLQTLAELHCAAGQWQEAVKVYSSLVGLSDDPDLLLRVHVELGRIYQDELGETKRAISSFQNVLAIEPQQRAALNRLADLFMQQQEWESAAEMVQRLLSIEQAPAEKVEQLVALGEIYERGYRDLGAAASRYQSALDLDPSNASVVDRLVSLHSRLGQWERACEATRIYLGSLPEERQREGLPRRMTLAKILHGTLRRPSEALEQYRAASEIDPTHIESRLRAGEILAEEGRQDEAVAQLRDILELDPLNAEALQTLTALWQRMGASLQAYAAAAVLVATGSAREQEQRLHREGRMEGVRAPTVPLEGSIFASTLVHSGEHHTGRAVLSALAEVAPKLFPAELSSWQVGRADRLASRGDDPVMLVVRQVRDVLGLEQDVDVYLSHTRLREMDLLMTDPPCLVVGGGVMSSYSSREVRFEIAKLLSYLRNATVAAYRLDVQGLRTLIGAARRVVDPLCDLAPGVDPAAVMVQADVMERALSRRARRQLEEAVMAFKESRLPSYEEWHAGLELTAMRVALWVVNDIETALRYLRGAIPELGRAKSSEAFARAAKQHRVVAELVRFWLSEDYLRARGGA